MTRTKLIHRLVVDIFVFIGLLSSVYASVVVDTPVLTADEHKLLESGDFVIREVQPQKPEGMTFEVIGIMHAPVETIFQLLSDYKAYPDYMSAVDSVNVEWVAGELSTISYYLKAFLGIVKQHRVDITATQHTETSRKIQWELVEWPGLTELETIRDTQGFWLIMERSPESALVYYYVYTDPGPVPFGLGRIVKTISKSSIEDAFLETKHQAEKISASNNP